MTFQSLLDFFVPADYVWDRWAYLFTHPLDNVWFIIAWALTMLFGIQQYQHATKVTKECGRSPYPLYMHTFYFAHDGTWFYIFTIVAIKYRTVWWFYLMILAFVYWTYSEMSLIKAVINNDEERNYTWKSSHPNGISKQDAWKDVWMQIGVFWGVTALFRLFMGSGSLWQWTIITNVLMQVGPVYYWKTFKTRKGTSLPLAAWILGCTIYTFCPFSAYVVAFPEIFNKPTYYISGIIMVIVGIYGVRLVKSLPVEKAAVSKK